MPSLRLTRSLRALLVALALPTSILAVPSTSRAQGSDEVVKQEARDLYRKGVARYHAGQFAQARSSFLAAWALEKHWSIAVSLGDCELMLERYRDAAEHLEFALRHMPDEHDIRADTQHGLDRARVHVADVRVRVNVEQAEVLVDGTVVAKSPLQSDVFLEPGAHTFEARVAGREPVHSSIDAIAGASQEVELQFPAAENATPAEPVKPTAPSEPAAAAQSEPATTTSNTRTIVVASGAALTVVAAGAGLLFSHKASSASSDADDLRDRINQQLGPAGCGGASVPICTDLRNRLDDHDAAKRNATIAWIGSGVLLTATIGTYLLWPKERKAADVSMAPVVLPQGAALSFQGRFQ